MNQFKARLLFICALLLLGAAAVAVRLFVIQVLHGDEYADRSRLQSQQRCILPAQRGAIYDRRGRVLAAGTGADLSITADVLGVQNAVSQGAPSVKRVYPLGVAEGPLVGYVGRDGYGLGGVEFSYDKYLRGEDGWTILQRDGRNRRYRKIGLPYKQPRPGSDVYLTIDAEIQKAAYNVVNQAVASLRARGGLCMVMDPFTGKVLAMVNEPSFDPNCPERFPLDRRENACVSTIFEPGSTFKLVTAAAALQDNVKKEGDVLDGNHGTFEIYHQIIRDHEPWGKLTFTQALAHSSNVCFAKIALSVGANRLYRFAGDFGFGARSGIELPGEESGIVHPIRKWSGRTLVTMAIGQEVSVTLAQLMAAYAAVANGGVLVRPQICDKIVDQDGKIVESHDGTFPVRRVISQETAHRLAAMLKTVVDSGTGAKAGVANLAIAGKTGTAQKIDSGAYSKTRSYASFIGFLPVERPCLLVGVVIDEPADNLMGGTAAAPLFRKIVTQVISHPELEYAELILKNRPVDNAAAVAGKAMAAVTATVSADRRTVAPDTAKYGRLVPDCVGRDARDAVNLINLRGMVPYLIGGGIVRRQNPSAGSSVFVAQPCTLVCSFGG